MAAAAVPRTNAAAPSVIPMVVAIATSFPLFSKCTKIAQVADFTSSRQPVFSRQSYGEVS
jgi:hypothetical protein